MSRSHELDLTQGPILKKLILFSLPILGISMLQLLFKTVDLMILGQFAREERATVAVGAVGSTTGLINLIIGFFVGISLGANAMVARKKGARDLEGARKCVGSAVLLSFVAGIILFVVGFFGSRTFLTWMNCKDEFLDMATAYLKIYFIGIPIIMFYNFSASILRAVGDTFRPMLFLMIAGVVNVGLNIFFVVVVGLDVEGVAIATVASNFISALCCFVVMVRHKGFARLEFRYLKFYKKEVKDILYIGIPSGLQSIFYNISNVLIQANINALGVLVSSGNSVAREIDSFICQGGEAVSISMLSFTSQNLGAKKIDRIKDAIKKATSLIIAYGLIAGGLIILFSVPLCYIIRHDPAIIPYAQTRFYVIASTYFLYNITSELAYVMRGLGKSMTSMIITLFGNAGMRIVFTILAVTLFPGSFFVLLLSFPLSWGITVIVQIVFLTRIFGKLKTKNSEDCKTGEPAAVFAQ